MEERRRWRERLNMADGSVVIPIRTVVPKLGRHGQDRHRARDGRTATPDRRRVYPITGRPATAHHRTAGALQWRAMRLVTFDAGGTTGLGIVENDAVLVSDPGNRGWPS